jgi:hypothetical protein
MVTEMSACHTDHSRIFTSRAASVTKALVQAYVDAVGGDPTAATRRRALDAAMAVAPGVALTMQHAFNIEAGLRYHAWDANQVRLVHARPLCPNQQRVVHAA